jgi:hypothetical protein
VRAPPRAAAGEGSSLPVVLFLQGGNEFLSLQLRLLHNRDQCALRQLWVILHGNDKISFFIPEVNMASGLAIDLKSKMISG